MDEKQYKMKKSILTLYDLMSIGFLGASTICLFALLSELNILIACVFGFLLLGLISVHAKKTCMENDRFLLELRRYSKWNTKCQKYDSVTTTLN
jgi:hypothetical protein